MKKIVVHFHAGGSSPSRADETPSDVRKVNCRVFDHARFQGVEVREEGDPSSSWSSFSSWLIFEIGNAFRAIHFLVGKRKFINPPSMIFNRLSADIRMEPSVQYDVKIIRLDKMNAVPVILNHLFADDRRIILPHMTQMTKTDGTFFTLTPMVPYSAVGR